MPATPRACRARSASAPHARLVADRLTYAPADGRALFHDRTLAFGRERTGLVGANGSGKTTLVRLLAGDDWGLPERAADFLAAIGVERRVALG